MIWKKTLLGVAELKNRSLSIDPAARNLLFLIDGVKTAEMFLAHTVGGVRLEHFRALFDLHLIEPATPGASVPWSPPSVPAVPAVPLSPEYAVFAETLSQSISEYLGDAGFGLGELAHEARTGVELGNIAENAIALIRERHGNAAAEEVAWRLFSFSGE